jgi:hypothetical protein
VGQLIGEVLKQLDEDRFIVKVSSGPRYVVGVRKKVRTGEAPEALGASTTARAKGSQSPPSHSRTPTTAQLDKAKLVSGTRVTLDMTTLTIMRQLPREIDPNVYQMLTEDPGAVSFSSVGGLNEQIRELREVIELPLTNPELFKRVGIKPPKVRTRAGLGKGRGDDGRSWCRRVRSERMPPLPHRTLTTPARQSTRPSTFPPFLPPCRACSSTALPGPARPSSPVRWPATSARPSSRWSRLPSSTSTSERARG